MKVAINNIHKIGIKKCITEVSEWADKMSILRGKDLFIDPELTREEYEIQRRSREIAKE